MSLHILGWMRVTKVVTIRYKSANSSKSSKIILVLIIFWKKKYDDGIISNRILEWCGETIS